ncbi:MAG: histidine kinase [Chitinophagaceae bacterium]|nr:histidine kinase [Chitinophagaceae bacterium]
MRLRLKAGFNNTGFGSKVCGLLSVAWLLAVGTTCCAQLPFLAERLTEAEGLSSNYVEKIAWDHLDRLWIATDKGVTLYNGQKTTIFSTANGLEQSYISELLFWPRTKCMLLLAPAGKLFASDGKRLHKITFPGVGKVERFAVLSDGDLVIVVLRPNKARDWYVAAGLDAQGGFKLAFSLPPGVSFNGMLMGSGLVRVADKSYFLQHATRVALRVEQFGFSAGVVLKAPDAYAQFGLVRHNNQLIWTENANRYTFTEGESTFKNLNHPIRIIHNNKPALLLSRYNEGNMVLFLPNGTMQNISAAQTGLPPITAMQHGPGGYIFIATLGQGIYYFRPNGLSTLLADKKIARIAADGDCFWIAGNNEIIRFLPDEPLLHTGMGADAITSITPTADFLHVTGISAYLRYPKTADGLGMPVYTFYNTAGISGYYQKGRDSFQLSTYTFGLFNFKGPKGGGRRQAMLDNIIERTIPFAGGVAYTSYSAGTFLQYTNGSSLWLKKDNGLLSNMVYDVSVQADSIWVATEGGLNLLVSRKVMHFDEAKGFCGKKCLYTFADSAGRRFVLSDNCLMIMQNGRFKPLWSVKIKKKESSIISVLFSPAYQQLLIGTSHGLNLASVSEIGFDTVMVMPMLMQVTISGGLCITDSNTINNLVLEPNVRDIVFEVGYSSTDYSGNAILLYYLEGWGNSWQLVPRNGMLQFPVLPAGHYSLRLRATNADGYSSPDITVAQFYIMPPLYKRWYMVMGYMVAISLALLWAVRRLLRLRLARQRQIFEVRQQLETERKRISSELHDNVGSQLTGIIAQLDYLEAALVKQNKQQLQPRVERLQQKARFTMAQLRESIWILKEDAIKWDAFILKVHRLLEDFLVPESGIQYRVSSEPAPNVRLTPWQAVNLLRVLQEGLQNILKHAAATEVTVDFKAGTSLAEVQLCDNGKGMVPLKKAEGEGCGLQNISLRMQHLGGSFSISSPATGGTVLYLSFPLKAAENRANALVTH